MLGVRCQVSHFTCNMWHVTCHMSQVTFFLILFLDKVDKLLSYQRGLPRLVFKCNDVLYKEEEKNIFLNLICKVGGLVIWKTTREGQSPSHLSKGIYINIGSLSKCKHVSPECDEYLFSTKYKYRMLFGFQKSPNTKYWILCGIEKIRILNTNCTNWSNYLNIKY